MWTNVDALNATLTTTSSTQDQTQFRLSSPAPEPHANSMKTTYSKLKTLTKRYSATLPIFSHKSSRMSARPRPKSD